MSESIDFDNYKAMSKASLPLAPFTLLLGPNGSGKSSILQALQGVAQTNVHFRSQLETETRIAVNTPPWRATASAMSPHSPVRITLRILEPPTFGTIAFQWNEKPPDLEIKSKLRVQEGALPESKRLSILE